MTLLTWLRDLGARWAAPRPDPPELAAVEAQIGPDPRAALAVDRALGAVGTCTYSLGKGGRHPESPTPGDAQGRLDCSGFASWCLGLDRKSDAIDGGWISTDSIVRDATGKRRLFRVVPAGQIRAGDLVVFPGRYVAGRRVAIGHVGVVVDQLTQAELRHRLLDIHETRLREMDQNGLEMMILSLNAPAVQAIPDRKTADEIARRANDFLAEQVVKRPDRFQAFAADVTHQRHA
mgnify:CR=1 FL=1